MTDEPHRITYLIAAVAIDPDNGDEGIIGVSTATGWVPLIASDAIRLSQITEMASKLAAEENLLVRLCRFSSREEISSFDRRPLAEKN